MTKKNNEKRLIALVLTLVVTVLSVIIIVTGIVARRNDGKTPPADTKTEAAETDGTKPPKPTVKPDTSRQPETSKPIPNETKPPETEDVFVPDDSDAEDVVAEPELPVFIAPARGNVSKKHSETVLVYSITTDDYRTHSGIDISGALGDVVVASAEGYVKSVYEDPMWGTCVEIMHEGDAVSRYMNLAPESTDGLTVGAHVKAGAVIGAVGESALLEIAEEPHLHFELKISGVSVDPEEYFEVSGEDVYEE